MEPYRFASGETYGEPTIPDPAGEVRSSLDRPRRPPNRLLLAARRRATDPRWGQRSAEERRRLVEWDARDQQDEARWREGGRR